MSAQADFFPTDFGFLNSGFFSANFADAFFDVDGPAAAALTGAWTAGICGASSACSASSMAVCRRFTISSTLHRAPYTTFAMGSQLNE